MTKYDYDPDKLPCVERCAICPLATAGDLPKAHLGAAVLSATELVQANPDLSNTGLLEIAAQSADDYHLPGEAVGLIAIMAAGNVINSWCLVSEQPQGENYGEDF